MRFRWRIIKIKYHFSDAALVYNNKNNELECWYRYSKNGVIDQIYRRRSKDGIIWTKRELLLDHQNCKPKCLCQSIQRSSDRSKWNGKMIYRSSFIKIKENYIVYYAGMAENYFWRIGVAVGKSLNNLKYI